MPLPASAVLGDGPPGVCATLYRVRVRGRSHEYLVHEARVTVAPYTRKRLGRFRERELAEAAVIQFRREHPAPPRAPRPDRTAPLKGAVLELLELLPVGGRRTARQVYRALAGAGVACSARAVKRCLTALHAADLVENLYDHTGYALAGRAEPPAALLVPTLFGPLALPPARGWRRKKLYTIPMDNGIEPPPVQLTLW